MMVLKIILNFVLYIISGFLIFACNDINKQLIASSNTSNSMQMLGFGLSKIVIIPILIILYLLLIGCLWTTFISSIKMLSRKTKVTTILGIILLLINLTMIGFSIYLIVQLFQVII